METAGDHPDPGWTEASVTPQRLRCEYRTNPLGVDITRPSLAWELAAARPTERGLRQSAYQVVVASTRDALDADEGDLWDSGKITSDQSVHVIYDGAPLGSGADAWWKVRTWDGDGLISGWSAPAHWSAGLLRPEDWKAGWIGLEEEVAKPGGQRALPARMVRKEFSLPRPVRRAIAYVCGLGLFELRLNGAKVGADVLVPGLTDYDKRTLYVTYDVTGQIAPGSNAIGVILGNGRYFAPRQDVPAITRSFGYPKLLLQLEVEHDDHSRTEVVSDESWAITTKGPIRANNEYDGELYDSRMEMPGWDRPGFEGDGWRQAQAVAAPAGRLTAQPSEPIRVAQTLRPLSVTRRDGGAYIYDMGQNMVGWCRLKLSGRRGERVTLRHAESLTPGGDLYVDNLRSAQATDTYVAKGEGEETYEPRFTYHGFRYVEVQGFPGEPDLEALSGCVVHDALEPAGGIATSNPVLNSIYRNAVWGTKGNMRSVPTDCPQRDERHGWLGDRSVESRGECYFFDAAQFYAKWLDDISDGQRESGSIADIAPAYWSSYTDNVTWPSSFIIVAGQLYDHYGDLRLIRRHYPAMRRWIEMMSGYMDKGLMPRDFYGDWCVPPPEGSRLIHADDSALKTDGTLIATAYFHMLLNTMSRFALLVGESGDADRYSAMAVEVRAAFNAEFLNPGEAVYSNGSQTSSVLPLAFGMVPEELRAGAFGALSADIEGRCAGHVGTGLIGSQWLMRTLSDNGRDDLAYRIAANESYPSWGYMLSKGATTIWELWNGDSADPAMNSQNHVMLLGDLCVWLYERLAGIRPDPARPGFRHVIIAPRPLRGLASVKAWHRGMYGTIVSGWELSGSRLSLEVSVPPNSTATIYVPAADAQSVTESGRPAGEAEGLEHLGMQGADAVYKAGSGSYRFVSAVAL